ncbi:hypothetical protein [Cohnella cholangitidis]|uniref:hypothetical protein n=1 Tax=Cohnella cholangitidis TaxID=2598458 RepID=UPI001E2A19DA|nr:hypothetical protein [Cohnella cholangitidis]
MLGCELVVPNNSQYLPSLGAAALAFRQAGWCGEYASLCQKFKGLQEGETFLPNGELRMHYDAQYAKYKRIYPAIAPLFADESGSVI